MKRNYRERGMIFLKTAAFCLSVIGMGGIAGAIETGTSPVNAAAVFLLGCLAMAVYTKTENISYQKKKTYGKEEVMSGLEKEELRTRTQGMTPEEQAAVAGYLSDEILWNELHKRFSERSAGLAIMGEVTCRLDMAGMKIGSATRQSYRT